MGLILCRKNEVRTPLYSKTLATAIYSYEELSFLIYENPILATEDLVNEELISFIRDELGMSTFGDWLALQKKRGMKEEDLLIHILEYGDLYSNAEVIAFRSTLARQKQLTEREILQKKADFMFRVGRYALAARYYQHLIDSTEQKEGEELGEIYHDLASAYANLFRFDLAFENYKMAYEILEDEEILKKMYFLTLMEPEIPETRLPKLPQEGTKENWDNDYEAALNRANASEQVQGVGEIFAEASQRKQRARAAETLQQWKKEYRNMVST